MAFVVISYVAVIDLQLPLSALLFNARCNSLWMRACSSSSFMRVGLPHYNQEEVDMPAEVVFSNMIVGHDEFIFSIEHTTVFAEAFITACKKLRATLGIPEEMSLARRQSTIIIGIVYTLPFSGYGESVA